MATTPHFFKKNEPILPNILHFYEDKIKAKLQFYEDKNKGLLHFYEDKFHFPSKLFLPIKNFSLF